MTEEHQGEASASPEHEQPTANADEVMLLREQLEEALREKEQFRAMAQRAQADLVNYKRRAADEQEELRRTANSRLILKVLAIGDDLNRGLDLVPGGAVAPGWLEGLRLVQRNLDKVLDAEGLTKIDAEGHAFEPWEHEAVAYEETPDGQEGIVVRIIRQGYKHHGRVIRPAQVAVSKLPGPQNLSESSQQEA